MKQTVNFSEFCDRFATMDRNENFSYEGKKALFAYLEELEQDTGEEIELDVIALCCEYSEYNSAVDAFAAYEPAFEYGADADTLPEDVALGHLNEHTQVIEFDGGVIIQNY